MNELIFFFFFILKFKFECFLIVLIIDKLYFNVKIIENLVIL